MAADETDVYADIRQAMRPEYASLPAHMIAAVAGRDAGLIVLHRMLSTAEPGHAALAVLLGDAGRRRIRANGAEMDVAAYLRQLSALCREAAEHAEQAQGSRPVVDSEAWLPTIAASVVDPFPAQARQMTLNLADPALTGPVNLVASDPAVSHLCAAVIDLTDPNVTPAYAGFNDQDMVYVGSLQKISAMYAAFELRSRVRAQTRTAIQGGLSTSTPNWQGQIIHDLETVWQPKLTAEFPGLPREFPNINQIFSFSASGQVDFATASPPVSIARIDQIRDHGQPEGKFGDHLKMMLRWSNNTAASLCIRPLSYPYINGVLAAGGFFDTTEKKGMWLSGDYEGHDWLANDRAGQALSPRWQHAQSRTRSNMTGTAWQIARFMACLATDTLLDPVDPTTTPAALHQEMRDLMTMTGAPGKGIGSYVLEGLSGSGRIVAPVVSKIGFGNDSRSNDCAIVNSEPPNKTLRYVVVGLGSNPGQRVDLDSLFVRLHDIISARHP